MSQLERIFPVCDDPPKPGCRVHRRRLLGLRGLSIQQSGFELDDAVAAVAAVVPSIVLVGGDDNASDEE